MEDNFIFRLVFAFVLILFVPSVFGVTYFVGEDDYVVLDTNNIDNTTHNSAVNQSLVLSWDDYIFAFSFKAMDVYMYASYDNGKSWVKNKIITNSYGNIGHLDVVKDFENNFHLVFFAGPYRHFYSYSTDLGESWTEPEIVTGSTGTYGVVTIDVNNFEPIVDRRARVLNESKHYTRRSGAWVNTSSQGLKGRAYTSSDKNVYVWGTFGSFDWDFRSSYDDGDTWNDMIRLSGTDYHAHIVRSTDKNIIGSIIYGGDTVLKVFMPKTNSFTSTQIVKENSTFFSIYDNNLTKKYLALVHGADANKIDYYSADYGADFSLVESYDLNAQVISARFVPNPNNMSIVADIKRNTDINKVYFRIPPASLTITNPTEGMVFNQRESMDVTFEIKDISDNQIKNIFFVQYKLKEADEWTLQIVFWSQGYGFRVDAPNEVGDYNLSVRALINGEWVHNSVGYSVEPWDVDLKVNFIKPVQVVEDVDLVAGKATAVKVGITNTNDTNKKLLSTIRLEFNDKNYEEDYYFVGDQNYIFYVNNPYQNTGEYTINAEIYALNREGKKYEETNENNNYETANITVKDVKTLVLIFTPVDLNKEDIHYTYSEPNFLFNNYYIENFDTYYEDITTMTEFLYSTYPLRDIIILPNTKVYCLYSSCPTNISYDKNEVFNILEEIKNEQWLAGAFSDILNFEYRIVGVVPKKWFKNRTIRYKGNVGFTNGNKAVLAEYPYANSIVNTITHEIGHTIWRDKKNLCEEYLTNAGLPTCPNPSPSDCNCISGKYCLGSLVNSGVWVSYEKEFTSVDTNLCNKENTFSFMGGFGSYPPERWATFDEYQHLFSFFEVENGNRSQGSDINILFISGLVDINWNVDLGEAYVIEGQEFGSSDGNCAIRTTDFNGYKLNDYNFAVNFLEYSEPPPDPEYSSFTLGIPFSEDINSIQIICNGELKAERFVSDNSPTVSIISPSGGEEWHGENIIEWIANDLDGDYLEFVLQYSNDNGLTWNPLGMHVTDENFTFDVGMVDGNTSYKIKVIATDGILTGEDISSTFTILNPNITIVPNEWNLETINDLQNVSQDFNIINSGNADLNVFDENHSENLNVTGLSLPIVLQPGEGHVFSVELQVLDMNLGEFIKDINLGSNDPNQIVKRIKIYGEIEEAKPDFRITEDNITFSPVYPEEDQNVIVSALVENLGDLNASDVNVSFYVVEGVDSNTIALYHAESGSGSVLIDETGNQHGSFKGIGEPLWDTNSKFGEYSLNFDGSNDYISVSDDDELDLVDELSVEFWFYANGYSGSYQGILAKRSVSANYGANVKDTAFQWYFRESGGGYQKLVFTPPSAQEWHYFLGTFEQINPTTVRSKAYIDGILQGDSNFSGNLNNTINTDDLIIGSSTIGYEPFNGLIDEIRISNKVREPFDFVIEEKTLSFIDANSTELVSVDWNNVQAEGYDVFVVVDDENLFDERDETNNSDYNSVTVYSEPILSIEFEFDALNDLGEPFDLNVIVENNGAKLLDANATLILPAELTTTDSLTKTIGDLNSHTSTKVEWQDINSSDSGMFEITVRVQATNADENRTVYTSIRHIELQNLNLSETVYPDDSDLGTFNIVNFNPSTSYANFYFSVDINGPENYSYDENISLLHAGETKAEDVEWSAWKEIGNYNVTVSLYDPLDELVDQAQGSFEVISHTPSLLTYYSVNGLTFNPEFTSYADYFSSASDENQQVMVVYSYDEDLNYSIRNPIAQEWTSPLTIGSGDYPYLVGDGNDFHLVYVDENVYYRKYSSGAWNSAELVSVMSSVDPVLTFDGIILYSLFSSEVNGLFNVFLAGFDGSWNTEIELTHCLDANCSNPIVLDEGLVDGKLSYAYRKFKGEEYSTLDSNLMHSLFDVNYFYWGS